MIDFSQNYFQLFGLSPSFQVDKQHLSEQYRQLQRELHPDKFASHSASEKRLSVQFAALVNKAYQTLKSPLLCAEYLLELADHPVNSESLTINGGEFLFRQMEWREALAELAAEDISAEKHSSIEQLTQDVQTEKKKLLSEFDTHYQQQDFDEATEVVAKLHFVEKMLTEIDRLEDDLLNSEQLK